MVRLGGQDLTRLRRHDLARFRREHLGFIFQDFNQVMGMTLGGDDFITKPYSGDVLLARISAVLRRTYGRGPMVDTLEHGGLRLDLSTGIASHGERQAELTRNELKLLHALVEKRSSVVTREQLMERLWSQSATETSKPWGEGLPCFGSSSAVHPAVGADRVAKAPLRAGDLSDLNHSNLSSM